MNTIAIQNGSQLERPGSSAGPDGFDHASPSHLHFDRQARVWRAHTANPAPARSGVNERTRELRVA